MRFLRRFFARPEKRPLNEHLELVYWRTVAEVEPLMRPRDDVSAAA